ncbi:DUF1871 family protein [Mesobacillus zeae]|uniref:DUF1871 family protein n=2 Tax=Mesobacillus zeae TaxID=1917180 RepID=A0A398BH39_9BACI|nr:DUF1871 family protein [Mesobacillus zeae]
MTRQMTNILNEWDPFSCGAGGYDPEIADVLQAVHDLDEPHNLAVRIQAIYEHSFEETLPYDACFLLAKSLLAVKGLGECTL